MPELPYFIYKINPTRPGMLLDGPTREEEMVLSQHSDYLENLTNQGVALLVGRTLNVDPSSFGIVIIQARSLTEARKIMNEDPAVHQGIMRAVLYPFKVVFQRPWG